MSLIRHGPVFHSSFFTLHCELEKILSAYQQDSVSPLTCPRQRGHIRGGLALLAGGTVGLAVLFAIAQVCKDVLQQLGSGEELR